MASQVNAPLGVSISSTPVESAPDSKMAAVSGKVKKLKCSYVDSSGISCRKKVSQFAEDQTCKCMKIFCRDHLFRANHGCSFNYQGAYQQALREKLVTKEVRVNSNDHNSDGSAY